MTGPSISDLILRYDLAGIIDIAMMKLDAVSWSLSFHA